MRNRLSVEVTPDRIFELHHKHDGKLIYSEVEKPDPEVREIVIAIFYTGEGGPFVVCTRTRKGGTNPR